MNIKFKSALLLGACLFSWFINTMQQQVQRQAQAYHQNKKLIKKQGAEKQKTAVDDIAKNNNTVIQPTVETKVNQPAIIGRLAYIEKNLTDRQKQLLEREKELNDRISQKQDAKAQDCTQGTLTQKAQLDNVVKAEPSQKIEKHIRICPFCNYPSTDCFFDQERLNHGEIVPCACKKCCYKNYGYHNLY